MDMKEKNTASPRPAGKLPVILVSVLVVIALIVNVVCIQLYPAINAFMAANLNSRLTGGNVTAEQLTPEEAKEASLLMAQELEAEGLVLLENKDGALPLEQGAKVNLFGYATISPLYGGTGSGSSDTSSNVDLIQGLTNAGFTVNEELADFYRNSGVSRPEQGGYTGSNFTPAEVPASQYTDEVLQQARDFSDVAVVMLSRIGGEGGDLPADMYAAGYSDTDDGRSYLSLTQDEEDLLELVKSQGYETVVVLINSSHAMELGFLEDDGIDAALWIGGPGSTGMNAVGEALSGVVNPSGRLTDTYAYDISSSPAYWNAGDFTYSNLERNYVEYAEGIYVGYRFYETRWIDNETGLCDEEAYQAAVQYPFGYGLSYTTFTQEIEDYSDADGTISMTVKVTNTGSVPGKDVVQVYYTAPYTVGGIEKAHVVLAGFDKTELLQPGDSQSVTITFAAEDMASYDYQTNGCYVLESGTYQIKLMNNAHDVIDQREYTVSSTTVYDESNPRSTDVTAAVNRFDDVTNGQITQYVSRADWEGTLPTARTDGKTASDEVVAAFTNAPVYENNPDDQPITFANHGLTLEDLSGKDYDDPMWEQLLEQLSVEDMTNMISNGGWSTPEVTSVGKPATNDLDGPAGINSLVSNLRGVSFPSQVVIGSTWNQTLVEEFGRTFGAEAVANHVVGLYAPGANIHRTPLSGRNFEYYSEDSLLSGKLAAATIRGAASQGVYCYVKHFALNDQESNRLSLSVWANEQSMREIYLRAFEIAVKEGGTTAIMSSYNYLGTVWAGANPAMLNGVLRDEWGFRGVVVTDSAMGNTGWMDVNLAIRAGGDMMLCLMGVTLDSSSNTAQQAMRTACHNILYTQANSAAVAAAADTSPYWLVLLVVLDTAVLSAALFVFLNRSKWKDSVKVPARIGIVVVIALVLALIFWAAFFRTGGVAAADGDQQSPAPTASETVQPTESAQPGGDAYLTLTGTGDGWLVCNVVLMPDNTFTVAFDYNAENSGIQTDSGTWALNDDGSITLTGDTRSFTATTSDGTNYTMDVENVETGIVCTVSGAVSGGSSAPSDGSYLTLTGTGDGWLVCNVVLMPDNTFTVAFDYNAENSGIQTDSGTWALNDDGSIALNGDTRSFTATTADGTNYTMDVENVETSIVCTVSGAVSGGSSAPSDGSYLTLTGTGDGWLVCNVVLMPDNTFTVAFDYNAENSGIQTDSGTWVLNDDGSIALTGDTRSFTATTSDGTNYTMDVENLQTGIVCTVSGTANT